MIGRRRNPIVLWLALWCVALPGCVQTVDRPGLRLSAPQADAQANVIRGGELIDAFAKQLANDLVESFTQTNSEVRRVAFLPLRDTTGGAQALATTLGDALRVEVFRSRRFQVVADNDMQRTAGQLLTEDTLRGRGALDRTVLSKLGQALSADFIVDGRMTDSATHFRVTVEMIDISTGLLVATAQGLLPKSLREVIGMTAPRGRDQHVFADASDRSVRRTDKRTGVAELPMIAYHASSGGIL